MGTPLSGAAPEENVSGGGPKRGSPFLFVCFLFVGRYRSSINDTSCTPRVNPQVGYDSDMGPDYDTVDGNKT